MRKEPFIISAVLILLAFAAYHEYGPLQTMMDRRSANAARAKRVIYDVAYQRYDYARGLPAFLTMDILKGEHFWNPQVAIWIEDSTGSHLQTCFVTTSTAKGLFYSGRSVENFREFDHGKIRESSTSIRRVNALPYWSHKRGVKYKDGLVVPHPDQPLPDGITGATPKDNFIVRIPEKIQDLKTFRVMVEVNVAFDQNEYYSEYDFPDDHVYHSGAGLLGQPSVIYGKLVRRSDSTRYYVLDLLGHGHHSGATGEIFKDMSGITTAGNIFERIVVGVSPARE